MKGMKGRKGKNEKVSGGKKGRRLRPSRIFIYALALAALSGGGYLIYDTLKRKKIAKQNASGSEEVYPTTSSSSNVVPDLITKVSSAISKSSKKSTDDFPLKQGSSGARVTRLQQALERIIGVAAMKSNGGVDGKFGKGTATALQSAGYPVVIDEPTYNKIVGSTPNSNVLIIFNPAEVAKNLYKAAHITRKIEAVLQSLAQIKNTAEYSSVNDYYKKQTIVSKTIVNDLLSYVYRNNDVAKEQVKREFLRIGLKVDNAGTWSLQGFRLYKDLITLRATVITDSKGNKIPVKRNTILGDELEIANGMTWFRSVDNTILKVPTQDVKYT
jgi:hypothetical protein